ncbi:MAG: type II secretion system major pseudopilin GspG [Spirochaetota bacterium]
MKTTRAGRGRWAYPAAGPEAGWTFVETIIVIAIILVLTATVGFVAFRSLGTANVAAARSQIDTFSTALNSYLVDNRRYPTEEQGLDALWQRPSLEPVPENWQGPYLERPVPEDPWGNPYEYVAPGPDGLPYGIRSLGADGFPGGEGQDADIVSWEN